MPVVSLREAAWYGSFALDLIFATRLVQLRLAARYPLLFVYLLLTIGRDSALMALLRSGARVLGHNGYNAVYIFTQPLIWGAYFLVIVELYSRMLDEYPGVRRLGRIVMVSGLALVGLTAGILVVFDRPAGFDPWPFLSQLALQQRTAYFCLGALTLLLLFFVAHYRLPVNRNVWVLYACFGGFFLINSSLYALRRYFGVAFQPWRDLVGAMAYALALAGSVLMISRTGETEKRPISVMWGRRDPRLEAALSAQLQGFNQVLVKALRQ